MVEGQPGVGQDTSLGDGDVMELVQFLIVPDGQLKVPGDDPHLLVVPCSIARQLEDLMCMIFHDGGHVDGGLTFPLILFPFLSRTCLQLDYQNVTDGWGLGIREFRSGFK